MSDRKLVVLERDVINVLMQRGRKYYLRLKRNSSKNGVPQLYDDYCNQIGIDRDEADRLFYKFLCRKYPDLVKLIRDQSQIPL